MQENIDKRDRAAQFRQRLARAMEDRHVSQSALARHIGVDRSTVSQLLTDHGARLPNAHVVGGCAAALGVSADWLLGLSDRPESAAEILASSLSITEAPRALVDERIFDWHKEAAGYKIRYVPAALPDMLKTRAVLEWEYAPIWGARRIRPSVRPKTGWRGCAVRSLITKLQCHCSRSKALQAARGITMAFAQKFVRSRSIICWSCVNSFIPECVSICSMPNGFIQPL